MNREMEYRTRIGELEAEVARLKGKLLEVRLLVAPWKSARKKAARKASAAWEPELQRRGLAVAR